ncbi:MAG: helix-turn-helix transcriptional regulator [Saprospiraceae bacterium]|nr:helix-turn-helix transcriptional regulator [Saprospiraceae bacterium]MBK9680896.1 helix-turn-helix transcriptional regulator [Saprospiraceae bacterium]
MNQSNPIVLNSIPHEIHFNEIQKQVLVKLLNGQSYKAIASDMNISLAAVRQYAHRTYKKLKVSNKMEALIQYGDRGDNKSHQ